MEYIYELVCPIRGVTRYIGKAKNPEHRYMRHTQHAKVPACYKDRWIAALRRQGLRPTLSVVACSVPWASWQDLERACIAQGLEAGFPLTNTTKGGEGVVMVSPAAEARRIARVRSAWQSPELRAAHGKARRESSLRPEVREANRARMIARWNDPEYAASNGARVAAAYASPEARAAQSLRSKKMAENPEILRKRGAGISSSWKRPGAHARNIAALTAGQNKPEVRAKKSAHMIERHKDPVFAAKIRKAMADPEMIKRRNAAISAAKQRKKAQRLAAQESTPCPK